MSDTLRRMLDQRRQMASQMGQGITETPAQDTLAYDEWKADQSPIPQVSSQPVMKPAEQTQIPEIPQPAPQEAPQVPSSPSRGQLIEQLPEPKQPQDTVLPDVPEELTDEDWSWELAKKRGDLDALPKIPGWEAGKEIESPKTPKPVEPLTNEDIPEIPQQPDYETDWDAATLTDEEVAAGEEAGRQREEEAAAAAAAERRAVMEQRQDERRRDKFLNTYYSRYRPHGASYEDMAETYDGTDGEHGDRAYQTQRYLNRARAERDADIRENVTVRAQQDNMARRLGVPVGHVVLADTLQNAESPQEFSNALYMLHALDPMGGWDRLAQGYEGEQTPRQVATTEGEAAQGVAQTQGEAAQGVAETNADADVGVAQEQGAAARDVAETEKESELGVAETEADAALGVAEIQERSQQAARDADKPGSEMNALHSTVTPDENGVMAIEAALPELTTETSDFAGYQPYDVWLVSMPKAAGTAGAVSMGREVSPGQRQFLSRIMGAYAQRAAAMGKEDAGDVFMSFAREMGIGGEEQAKELRGLWQEATGQDVSHVGRTMSEYWFGS
jgi:hypothetical protein